MNLSLPTSLFSMTRKSLILTALILFTRDFPQRWPNFLDDLYSKVWVISENSDAGHGARICMECLSLLTEDCTDSDFNSKISTRRRNDILQGLNEVKAQLLPPIFSFLSQQYGILCTCKNTIREMESFLAREARQPTPIEQKQYDNERRKRDNAARLVSSTTLTLQKFCLYMPLEWMLVQNADYDFVSVFLCLLRENTLSIQVQAATCLDALSHRKLESSDWFRLVSSIPASVSEANQAAQEASEGKDGVQILEEQLPFHLILSKMLANLLSCHIAHVTTDKHIVSLTTISDIMSFAFVFVVPLALFADDFSTQCLFFSSKARVQSMKHFLPTCLC